VSKFTGQQPRQVNEMANPQNRIGFRSIGQPSGTTEFEPWMNSLTTADVEGANTLQDVVQFLDAEYDIEARPVQYVEGGGEQAYAVTAPDTDTAGEAQGTGYQALVNPAWEGAENADSRPQHTPVWHIATDEYSPVSPMDKYGPGLAALRGNGSETKAVFGEARLYRNGGEMHLDMWLPDISVTLAGDEYIIGIQTGYDYFGGTALYAEIVAARKETGTQMRGITDKRRRTHRGSAQQDVADWWQIMLEQAEAATDGLRKTVAEAQAYAVDFTELPISSEQYLLALFDGTASYAEAADDRLAGGTTPDECSAWALYDAMAETLTEDFDGKDESAALRKYLRGANEQLFSPPAAERTVAGWLEDYDDLEDQQDLTGEEIQAQLRDHRIGLESAVKQYRDTKRTLKRMLNETEA
jgi:hypothetical protein